MESFFSSLKTERTASKTYRTRDQAKADVFDYIERFYNPMRRRSTLGYPSPMEFERRAGVRVGGVNQAGSSPSFGFSASLSPAKKPTLSQPMPGTDHTR